MKKILTLIITLTMFFSVTFCYAKKQSKRSNICSAKIEVFSVLSNKDVSYITTSKGVFYKKPPVSKKESSRLINGVTQKEIKGWEDYNEGLPVKGAIKIKGSGIGKNGVCIGMVGKGIFYRNHESIKRKWVKIRRRVNRKNMAVCRDLM